MMSQLATIKEFDAEYDRLVQAAENNILGGHHTPELETLLAYCKQQVELARQALLADDFVAPPEVKAQLSLGLLSWQRYVEDMSRAADGVLAPLWTKANGGGYHFAFTTLGAERLRGHFKYFRGITDLHQDLTLGDYRRNQ